ncbi:MAG: sugar transferase [Marinovum algicola]|jgi:exopolysaccharide production protein ExoY|uniref:Sugar transferase involved in LPS biosynthesis (Colanic, teichoic acid) n=1 Tax=Marinovum algicola TaxID=42444 RepID=A0A975WDH7_9RHOB|nr:MULTISPECIES: sugar transferase [Marinovum]MDD9739525.1 sugar transferase [Marinovum sp. SP66]MDD9745407.1 sugar transferase [Marinovum sp. PR37]SEK01254.1 Sugar transferase involved in LPS biosynthesis (colanic, teichoic acid) [Marinovum algicola]SLN44543.1 Undecaprenyl phosphate N,N'-diacetylbacillosamine 1-phosphate transferase [Marinovum algicola]
MTEVSTDLPLSTRPGRTFYASFGKRALDLAIVLLLLPAIVPLIALLWLLVRSNGGPGFFGHTRIGLDGQSFRCWKIRTMVPDAERVLAETLARDPLAAVEWALAFKLHQDPRITTLGRHLRRLSLDELPQIWNVLRGEMSFVGPRPITAGELAFYDGEPQTYLAQKPGITGLWQVEGRPDGCYRKRVALDRRYRAEQSLPLDLLLLCRTAGLVLAPTGR